MLRAPARHCRACRDRKAHAACSFEVTVSQDGERFPQPAVARCSSSADEVAAADQIHEGVGRIAEKVLHLRPTNAALGIRGVGRGRRRAGAGPRGPGARSRRPPSRMPHAEAQLGRRTGSRGRAATAPGSPWVCCRRRPGTSTAARRFPAARRRAPADRSRPRPTASRHRRRRRRTSSRGRRPARSRGTPSARAGDRG